jgi:hypothetical protein
VLVNDSPQIPHKSAAAMPVPTKIPRTNFDRTASTAARSRNRDGESPEHEQSDGQAVSALAPAIADRYVPHPRDLETAEGSTVRLLTWGAPDPDSASGEVRARLAEAQFLQALADLSGDLCQARWTRAAVASFTAQLQALAPDPFQEMSASERSPQSPTSRRLCDHQSRPDRPRSEVDRGYER